MKRILLVIIILLFVCVGIVMFLSRSSNIINPLSKPSLIYDLSSVLEKNGLAFTSPIIKDNSIMASISGILVSFSTQKDFLAQVRALQLVLPKVKMDGSRVSQIDLRFDKVVIKYAER